MCYRWHLINVISNSLFKIFLYVLCQRLAYRFVPTLFTINKLLLYVCLKFFHHWSCIYTFDYLCIICHWRNYLKHLTYNNMKYLVGPMKSFRMSTLLRYLRMRWQLENLSTWPKECYWSNPVLLFEILSFWVFRLSSTIFQLSYMKTVIAKAKSGKLENVTGGPYRLNMRPWLTPMYWWRWWFCIFYLFK